MAYRFIETRAWERGVELLNPNARVSLRYALDRIGDEPHAASLRMQRPDGAWVDYGAERLLIAYEIIEPDRVRLLAVSDLKEAHRW